MRPLALKLARVAGLASVVLSIACSNSRPAKVSVAPPPEIRHAPVPAAQTAKLTPTQQRLHAIGAEMERLIAQSRLGVPDAVLNRTACLVVFPASQTPTQPREGFSACRNSAEQWTSPAVVQLRSADAANSVLSSDLYLFVLSERARQELMRGELDLRRALRTAVGPTTADATVLDGVSASKDIFAYSVSGDSLHGAAAPKGVVTSDRAETERLYGHPIDVSWLLDKSTMSSTVASFYQIDVGSFFNTIVPTGIIIHHSVLTPAGDIPETEQAIDRFHSARGYEVSCFGKVYHIAYHYLILPNGKVVSGRPERCEGAHARGYNSYLGIALVGNFSSGTKSGRPARPTPAQLKSLVRLCCYLRQKYHIPLQHIMPHNRVARTECPGDGLKFDTVLAAISSDSGAGS